MLTYPQLMDLAPFRSPAWRYERATEILTKYGGRSRRPYDDERTLELVKFLAVKSNAERSGLPWNKIAGILADKSPQLWAAFEVFSCSEQDQKRYTLEARYLTGQNDDQIARDMHLKSGAVETYASLFFDVRDRMSEIDYVGNCVIGQVFQAGLDSYNPELLAKYFGYFAGPVVLNMVLYAFSAPRRPANDDDVLAFLDSQVQKNIRTQALVLTTVLQPNRWDVRTIMEGYVSLLALDARAIAEGEQTEWLSSLVKTLRLEVPVLRGESLQNLEKRTAGQYSVGCVELRAHEQVRLVSQGGLPYYDDLAAFKIPPVEQSDDAKNASAKPSKPSR